MKVIEWIANNLIRQMVTIDESKFGVVPGRGTSDAIFVNRQLQEKYFTVGRLIWPLLESEKVFDRVQKAICWAMRTLVL